MATINEIKQQAEAVKNATQVGENTAERVGGALAGLADIAEQQDSKVIDLSTINANIKEIIGIKVTDLQDNSILNQEGNVRYWKGAYVSDFYNISEADTIKVKDVFPYKADSYIGCAFYDKDKKLVGHAEEQIFEINRADFPANTVYMRISGNMLNKAEVHINYSHSLVLTNLLYNIQNKTEKIQETKFDKSSVVQELGNSEELTISQKIVSDKLKNINIKIAKNLGGSIFYNRSNLNEKGLLKPSDGSIYDIDDMYYLSDYIDILGASSFNYTNIFPLKKDFCGCCIYDKDKTFIAAIGSDSREAISGTVNVSSYQNMAFVRFANFNEDLDPSLEVIYHNYNNKKNIFTVDKSGNGDYTYLTEAINAAIEEKDSIVYVNDGNYDIEAEYKALYGETFFTNYSYEQSKTNKGIVLKNRVKVIFSTRAFVIFHYTGDNRYVLTEFSPFNSGELGFSLVGMNLSVKKCRYPIHDERGYSYDSYFNTYDRCNIAFDKSDNPNGMPYCIGGGLGAAGNILIKNCIFSSVGNGVQVSYHNNGRANSKSSITCIGNYFGGKLRFSHYGNSSEVTDVLVEGNSMLGDIVIEKETEDSTIENMLVKAWNNVIRTLSR